MIKSFQYGGQAVIEGVMMRGPDSVAVAVRRPQGDVAVEHQVSVPVTEKYPLLKQPILRGVVALFDAMVLGIKMLTHSANIAMEEEEGEELSFWEIVLTIAAAVGLAVLLFVILPTAAVHFAGDYLNPFWQNILEGVLRILVFLAYVLVISVIKDIQRVFQYHGAEHKVIHAFEAGEDLSDTGKIQAFSTLHPRCGTAFLLIVMVLTIFFFSFLGSPGLLWRIASRIMLLPIIAGAAYELIKLSSRHDEKVWVRALIAPGLWLQKLTTREPDDSQVEVAVMALKAVLPQEQRQEAEFVEALAEIT